MSEFHKKIIDEVTEITPEILEKLNNLKTREIKFENGSVITFKSVDDKSSCSGLNFNYLFPKPEQLD